MGDERAAPVRSLVVGCNGFLGRQLAATLLANGARVDGVVRTRRDLVPDGVTIGASLDAWGDAPPHEVVYVVAAFIPYGAMDRADERLLDDNVRLVERIHRRWPHARLVYASSTAVYGTAPGDLTEELNCRAPSLYGQAKLAGEFVAQLHPSFAIVRFSSLCGRGMAPTTFLPRIVAQARATQSISLWGDGSRRQDYFHVDDAVALLIRAGQYAGSDVFLGACGQSVSNREIAEHVSRFVPGTLITHEGVDPSPSFAYDPQKTWQILGYRPTRSCVDAIAELANDA